MMCVEVLRGMAVFDLEWSSSWFGLYGDNFLRVDCLEFFITKCTLIWVVLTSIFPMYSHVGAAL